MQEIGGDGRAAELNERLARLEAQLGSQRDEIAALRVELRRLQDESPAADFLRPRKPEPAIVRPWLPPPPPPPQAPPPPRQAAPSPEPAAPVPAPPPPSFGAYAVEAKPHANRSVENRIGSQWLNRIGIVALLIAVTLALKFAVDKHWIHFTRTGRIATGLVLGTAVILWSERFRRKGYPAFSYSLKAVGTGTLYLTLWASFHLYHLLPAPVALTMMIAVTAWNAIMAWAQDAELLAVYALVGGFATPALLGSGGNHEVFLFSYVLAMDVAVLLLLAKKPWQRLLLGSFPGTVTYFIGWYNEFFTKDQAGVTGLFVVLLTLPFAAMALIGSQRDEPGEGFIAPLAAASFLACGTYAVLQDSGHHAWLAWAAVAAAAVYLLLMRVRREGLAEAIHLALAIIFLTIAIPLKAEGRWITVGWLAEGVVLLWVAGTLLGTDVQVRVRSLMRWLACIALGLGVGESLIFWVRQDAQHAFWNGRFWTEIAAVAALALAAWLARHPAHEDTAELRVSTPGWPSIALTSTLLAHLVAPLAVARELAAYWTIGAPQDAGYRDQLTPFSIAAFLMLYAAGLIAWLTVGKGRRATAAQQKLLHWLAFFYAGFGLLAMVVTPSVRDGLPAHAFWNQRSFFEAVGIAALILIGWFERLARQGREPKAAEPADLDSFALIALRTFGPNLLAAVAGAREIHGYWTGGGIDVSVYREQVDILCIAAFLMVYGACLLAWVATRNKSAATAPQRKMLRTLGSFYLAAGWFGLVLTPIVGNGSPLKVFWNVRLLMEIVGAAALAATAWLAWQAHRIRKIEDELWAETAAWCLLAFNLLIVLAGVREVITWFGLQASGDDALAEAFSISAWLMFYAAVLLAAGFWKRTAFVRWQGLILLVFTIGKVFLYDVHSLSSGYRILSFFGLGVVLMTVSFAYQKDWLGLRDPAADNDPEATP